MAKKGGKDFKRGDPDHPSHKQLAPNGLSFGVMMRNAIARAVDEATLTAIVKAQAKKAKDGDTDAFRALTDRMVGRPAQQVIVSEAPKETADFSDLDKQISHLRSLGAQTAAPPKPSAANGTLNGNHRGLR